MKLFFILASLISTLVSVYFGLYFLEIASKFFSQKSFAIYMVLVNVQSFLFLLDLGFGQHASRIIAINDLNLSDGVYLSGMEHKYKAISKRLMWALLIIVTVIIFAQKVKDLETIAGMLLMSASLFYQVRYSFQSLFLYAKSEHLKSKLLVIVLKLVPVISLMVLMKFFSATLLTVSGVVLFGVLTSRQLGILALNQYRNFFEAQIVSKRNTFLYAVKNGSSKVALFNLINFLIYRGPIIGTGLILVNSEQKEFIILFSLGFFMFGLSQTYYYLWYPKYLERNSENINIKGFIFQYALSLLAMLFGAYVLYLSAEFQLLDLEILGSVRNGKLYVFVLTFFSVEIFWQILSGYRFAKDDFNFAYRYALSLFIMLAIYSVFLLLGLGNKWLAFALINVIRSLYEIYGYSQR